MLAYNKFLLEHNANSLPIKKQMHKNYQATVQKNKNALVSYSRSN